MELHFLVRLKDQSFNFCLNVLKVSPRGHKELVISHSLICPKTNGLLLRDKWGYDDHHVERDLQRVQKVATVIISCLFHCIFLVLIYF